MWIALDSCKADFRCPLSESTETRSEDALDLGLIVLAFAKLNFLPSYGFLKWSNFDKLRISGSISIGKLNSVAREGKIAGTGRSLTGQTLFALKRFAFVSSSLIKISRAFGAGSL